MFLGTSAGVPTQDRGLPSIALRWGGDLLLFDCGEGTQRQMVIAGVGLGRKVMIFFTHMHGDHVLGLPGLLMTMSLMNRKEKLEIFGPRGLDKFVKSILPSVRLGLTFDLAISEIDGEGKVVGGSGYSVYSDKADHHAESQAYAFVEDPRRGRFDAEKAKSLGVGEGPGRSVLAKGMELELPNGRVVKPSDVLGPPRQGFKMVYTGDTRYCERIVRLSKGADVLIHDSTFDESRGDEAYETYHSTCVDAARAAREANAKKLFLFHISARYRDPSLLCKQAKKYFSNVEVAEDLASFEIR
ncbi:MAG: ribonuclease Z [Candidatus Brockarchaeota archaeon]|nr:ribonuclease Z [Candidatus Brockarchaeota archaeon]